MPFKESEMQETPDLKAEILNNCCETVLETLWYTYDNFKLDAWFIAAITFGRTEQTNYKLLSKLYDDVFDAFQQRKMDFDLKRWAYVPKCQNCWIEVTNPANAVKFLHQFSHKWECAKKTFLGQSMSREEDFYEKSYRERLYSGKRLARMYYIVSPEFWNETRIFYPEGDIYITSGNHWDFVINWSKYSFSLRENEELSIFYILLRYIQEVGYSMSYIIEELEKVLWEDLFWGISEWLKDYEELIERVLIDNDFMMRINDENNYVQICDSVREAMGTLIWILIESKRRWGWPRYNSLLLWLLKIQSWEIQEEIDNLDSITH